MEGDNSKLRKVQKEIVQELLNHISKEDYFELVNEFILDTRSQLKNIHTEAFSNNKQDLRRAIHTIKGNASSLGFDHLSQYTAEFEELIKSHKEEFKNPNFTIFVRSIEDALTSIEFFNNDHDRRRV